MSLSVPPDLVHYPLASEQVEQAMRALVCLLALGVSGPLVHCMPARPSAHLPVWHAVVCASPEKLFLHLIK